jgi:steroid 5-alpha reductase family enzyme
MGPLIVDGWIAATACLFVWVASLITKDTSWVDRLWSVLPVVYIWVFAASVGLTDARLDVMAVVVTLWGARLTFNFARKGGYAGVEDYRWAELRGRMRPWQFQLFNLFFITVYQNLLLLLIALPALTAWQHRDRGFDLLDAALAIVFLAFTFAETVADQQQWNFQKSKHREIVAGREPTSRFLRSGLFRVSRHPNFFFEQAQWWVIFFLGASAAGSVLQWTVVGAILLSVLFIGSTIFTENISRSRYPEYADYQRSTSAIIPWPPRHAARTEATT